MPVILKTGVRALDDSPDSDYADSMSNGKSMFGLTLLGGFLCFAALLFPPRIIAQENAAEQAVPGAIFAPFISRLSAEVKNNFVRLSWIDSPDVRGSVYIYRSNTPFTAQGPDPNAAAIEVPYGVQSYIDEIETAEMVYYYIAASDEEGQRFNLVLPYNNAINVTIGEGENGGALLTEAIRPSEQGGLREQPPDTGVSGLEAAVQENSVIISYQNINGNKSAILYRSVAPISQMSDLVRAVIVRSGVNSPVTDYPVPGIPYYYAVIFEEDLTRGNVRIVPGANATVQPVSVSDAENQLGLPVGTENQRQGIRAMPLPLISLYAAAPSLNSTGEIPQPGPLGSEAAKAIAGIKVPEASVEPPLKNPRAFSQDLEIPAGGEEYTLRSIVQDSFVKRDWPRARDELIRFLALPRSAATEARARFYLGQAYYFSALYRESLFEFLMVEAQYPQEAAEWMQAVLVRMVK
jgi:hypothetical protein